MLLITLLCLEGASLIYIAATQGRFHYSTPPFQSTDAAGWSIPETRLHPYFGYYSELAGFPPLHGAEPASDEVTVGIFGGSVAQSFHMAQALTNTLRDALQALPRYAGKRVRILNFSHSGYKQPQQLNVLNFYLANGFRIDVAILIDGLNEIGFNAVNMEHGMDISMPMSPVFSDLVRKCKPGEGSDETACRMIAAKNRAQRLQIASEETPLASAHLVYSLLAKSARKDFWNLSRAPRTEDNASSMVAYSLPEVALPADTPEPPEVMERSVQIWRYSTLSMLQAARLGGVELFEFIQPNQYYKTDRVLTPEEQSTAWNDKSILRRSVSIGYARLFQEAEAMRSQGLRLYDMTRIYDAVPETVYIDNCCHVNAYGNAIMEQFIADTITKELQSTQ
ncbi:hypothetical protein [Megalodesulfovibrio paquesii]